MTKIKDLVTVTVDTVFRFYPIDSERYDLWVWGNVFLKSYLDGDFADDFSPDRPDRFLETLSGIHSSFCSMARSYEKVLYSGANGVKPQPIEIDRFRRVIAALGEDLVAKFFPYETYEHSFVVAMLWTRFLWALYTTPPQASSLSLKDRRNPT